MAPHFLLGFPLCETILLPISKQPCYVPVWKVGSLCVTECQPLPGCVERYRISGTECPSYESHARILVCSNGIDKYEYLIQSLIYPNTRSKFAFYKSKTKPCTTLSSISFGAYILIEKITSTCNAKQSSLMKSLRFTVDVYFFYSCSWPLVAVTPAKSANWSLLSRVSSNDVSNKYL